jgi:hypothetical protein
MHSAARPVQADAPLPVVPLEESVEIGAAERGLSGCPRLAPLEPEDAAQRRAAAERGTARTR